MPRHYRSTTALLTVTISISTITYLTLLNHEPVDAFTLSPSSNLPPLHTSLIHRHHHLPLRNTNPRHSRYVTQRQTTSDPSSSTDESNSSRLGRIKAFAKSIIVRPASSSSNLSPPPVASQQPPPPTIAPPPITPSPSLVSTPPPPSPIQIDAPLQTAAALDALALARTAVSDAFDAAEQTISETEASLGLMRNEIAVTRKEVMEAIGAVEVAALRATNVWEQAEVVRRGGVATEGELLMLETEEEEEDGNGVGSMDVSHLSYEDVDYTMTEMAPPFIGEDQCLVPGEAVVRVEKAPENSRRIFAGIDIMASVDDVWNVLTDYEHLQRVVPNLGKNEVLELYEPTDSSAVSYTTTDPNQTPLESEAQCKSLSETMAGARLHQIGKAKVVGINFSARTTLEVREWPQGIPDFFHFSEDVFEGQSRNQRARSEKARKLERYRFPRPFAISQLPTRDITMQSVEDDDGEFRLYQGVWRMQPLPGCAPEGGSAMRLTYAVEISPRPYLPVAVVEGRISRDLCDNLSAIREYVTKEENVIT